MVPYDQEQEREILHQKKLTEAFFNKLFEQLKINEKHQKEQESLLLEVYLSYINLKLKGQNSDLQFKEFIKIIEDETNTRADKKIQSAIASHGFTDEQAYAQKKELFQTCIK